MRTDGRSVIGSSPTETGNDVVRVVCRRSIIAERTGAEVVITFGAVSEFDLSGGLDGGDFVGEVFKVVPNHECGIVWVRPWAEPGHWPTDSFKRPFDRFA